MMFIDKNKEYLIFEYESRNGVDWIYNYFEKDRACHLNKTFYFKEQDVYQTKDDDDEYEDGLSIRFILGKLTPDKKYYKIDKRILNINFDVYMQTIMEISEKCFIVDNNISIFRKLAEINKLDFYIGDLSECSVTISTFQKMVNSFPTSYELKLYVESRMSVILRNEFEEITDSKSKYEKYMNKKVSMLGDDIFEAYKSFELTKYEEILEKLKLMLLNQTSYNEKQWQLEILQIVQLLYPKYINVFCEVYIKDVYSGKNKRLDYMLVDSNGNVDIIEIKRPFNECILSNAVYRDNYIPMRELSGAVMQIEKYIFWLNKWGKLAENTLTVKYKNYLPEGFEIKIINPGAIIIMGRENDFSDIQKNDFEIIKRKYNNILDIITYDELIKRLEFIINKFK